MKAEYVKPFVNSTVNAFQTMLNVMPEKKDMFVKKSPESTYDVSAIIGLSGKISGMVTLSFPKAVANKAVSRFLCEEGEMSDADVADGISELVNIISGAAKADLNKLNLDLTLSLPNVIIGQGHTVWQRQDAPCICLLFTSEIGDFSVEVSLKEE